MTTRVSGILDGRDVRLARSDEERRTGMAGVADAADTAMVFEASPGDVFWMKGCLVPLDLVFVDRDGAVISVSTMNPPSAGEEPERAECPPKTAFVVEVRGGDASRAGLEPGDLVA